MKKVLSLIAVCAIFTLALSSWIGAEPHGNHGFTINGTVKGVKSGKATLSSYYVKGFKPITAQIQDGKFKFEGVLSTPHMYNLMISGATQPARVQICLENTTFTVSVDGPKVIVKGGKFQSDYNKLQSAQAAVQKKYNLDKYKKIFTSGKEPSKEQMDEYMKVMDKMMAESKAVEEKFMNDNPDSYYIVAKADMSSHGKSAEQLKEMVAKFPNAHKNSPIAKNLLARAKELERTEIGIANIIDAENVKYKVDNSFNGKAHKGVVYLGVFENDNVCALDDKGNIHIIDSKGNKKSSFKTEINGKPSSVAVEGKNIYIMTLLQEKTVQKIRGRSYERMIPKGIECVVYNINGKKLNSFKLEGAKTATGARIADGKLLVADYANRAIKVYNKSNGKLASTIDGMRPCCGILDLSVNDKNEVLVANLGAFRVESYNFSGEKIVAFGSRGRKVDEFQGCCNPVSVAYLSNGAIVTVEKDPTRVKIYSKEGAKQIEGIQELVKGCSYIPMIVDSKNNLYLASPEKGMIKCVSL